MSNLCNFFTPGKTKTLAYLQRDCTAASGDVAYTGTGFKPTSLMVTYGVANTIGGGVGFSDNARGVQAMFTYCTDGKQNPSANFIEVYTAAGGHGQSAIVKSYDDNGFTLTWTKAGTPSGIIYFVVTASN